MTVHVHLIRDTSVTLWSLSSRERLARMFERQGITSFLDDLSQVEDTPADTVILLRGDYLYDTRIIRELASASGAALRRVDAPTVVAAHVPASLALQARERLLNEASPEGLPGIRIQTPETLCSGVDMRLRKFEAPLLAPISATHRTDLERRLFDGAYKGVTDLVTKWAWPRPASVVSRICARLGIRPNHVTSVSWVLAVVVGFLFADGYFGWGLAFGWLMTFLDTVDGKLARVTVTYTRFGDLFDHVLDLVHPPLWYIAWGLGLASFQPGIPELSLAYTLWLIVAGYIGGRLIEGAFQWWVAPFSIFTWRPIDSFSRLITARRNPCMLMLTLAVFIGRPDLGLVAVAIWTLVSTGFLLIRLGTAVYERVTTGPLTSWLTEIDSSERDRSLAVRWFVG